MSSAKLDELYKHIRAWLMVISILGAVATAGAVYNTLTNASDLTKVNAKAIQTHEVRISKTEILLPEMNERLKRIEDKLDAFQRP